MKTKWTLAVAAALSLMMPHETKAGGACTAARFHDWNDMGCNQNCASAGTPAQGGCPQCDNGGMPRWWVSEPYINLCMADTPLSYTMSSGKPMEFKFYYRQRTKMPDSDEVTQPTKNFYDIYPGMQNGYGTTCGTNASWNHNWNLSVTIWDPTWESSWVNFGTYIHPSPGLRSLQPGLSGIRLATRRRHQLFQHRQRPAKCL